MITGDTRPNTNLIKFAKGADVLISEAYLPGFFERVDAPEVAKKLDAYHTSAQEAGEEAEKAGVKKLVLTHLMPPESEAQMIELAEKAFHGEVIAGSDLKSITLNGDK